MSSVLVSNPPYNLKWAQEPFMQLQDRFSISNGENPPANNANYLFILDALDKAERCAMILPNSILTTESKQEAYIRSSLVERNMIDAVILNPDNMFEATSIPTCILLLDKNKTTSTIEMVDCRKYHAEEKREQNGQYGGASHTNRTYVKTVNIYTPEQMSVIVSCIRERKNEPGFCKSVTIEEVRSGEYLLSPSRYIEFEEREYQHRPYEDMVNELNRIIESKNMLRITMNATLVKNLGLSDFYDSYKTGEKTDEALNATIKKLFGIELRKDTYFSVSKKKNEIKIENCLDGHVPHMLLNFLQQFKVWIQECNMSENIILAELRDALTNDLMTGKIDVSDLDIQTQ